MKIKHDKVIKKAAALKYEPFSDRAPKVVAAGRGEAAENILKKALEHDVPVHKDPSLADVLSIISPGYEIPPDLYEVVAEVLVFISQMDRDYGEKYRNI